MEIGVRLDGPLVLLVMALNMILHSANSLLHLGY